jgi:hypothetical protein
MRGHGSHLVGEVCRAESAASPVKNTDCGSPKPKVAGSWTNGPGTAQHKFRVYGENYDQARFFKRSPHQPGACTQTGRLCFGEHFVFGRIAASGWMQQGAGARNRHGPGYAAGSPGPCCSSSCRFRTRTPCPRRSCSRTSCAAAGPGHGHDPSPAARSQADHRAFRHPDCGPHGANRQCERK